MGEHSQLEMAFAAKHQQTASPSAGGAASSSSAPSCDGAKLRRAELCLRLLALLASVSAFAFLITDKQTRSFVIFTSVVVQEAVYSDMKALIFSVIILGVVALYSVSQIARCLFIATSTSIQPSSTLAWAIFLLDQIMTYLILSASAATAQSAYFSEQGNNGFHWAKVCYLYEKFCKQVGIGIVGSFVAFMALVFTSVISAFNLFACTDFA